MFLSLCSGFVEVLVVAAWGADSGRSTVLPLLCVFPFFCSLFCFLAVAVLLVAHGASGVSSDGEKETGEILQCLYSSLSIFFSSLSRLPSVLLPPPFVLFPPPPATVPPLDFIAQGKHCGGNGLRDSSHKTCPIIGAICCKTYPCFNAENGFL